MVTMSLLRRAATVACLVALTLPAAGPALAADPFVLVGDGGQP